MSSKKRIDPGALPLNAAQYCDFIIRVHTILNGDKPM